LHSNVVSNLYSGELNQPTKVQAEVFTHYKNFCDFLIASQTGSGKTLAFASPIISDLLFFQEKASLPNEILVLILTPTR
jgi:superfamily II DNA/RNA helicase